jgi:hypothetical protein
VLWCLESMAGLVDNGGAGLVDNGGGKYYYKQSGCKCDIYHMYSIIQSNNLYYKSRNINDRI